MSISGMTYDDLPNVMECYRNETVRFIRSPQEYLAIFDSEIVRRKFGEFFTVRVEGEFRGYFTLNIREPERTGSIQEFAGDRDALMVAFARVMQMRQLTSLSWQVAAHDIRFIQLVTRSKLELCAVNISGTRLVLNALGLMENLRPWIFENAGCESAQGLKINSNEQQLVFQLGGELLGVEYDMVVKLLFGTIEGGESELIAGEGKLAEMLRKILPLPSLTYGLNYV